MSQETPSTARPWLGWLVRIGIVALALGWTFTMAPPGDVLEALRLVPVTGLLAGLLAFAAVTLLAAVRWGVMMRAYGADAVPLGVRLNLTLLGQFQNTFLPGAVVGDLARSHLSRKAFRGAAGAYLVVALERVIGLCGLLILTSAVQLVRPVAGVAALQPLAAIALVGACGVAAAPFFAGSLARWAPRPVRGLLQSLPTLERPALLLVALVLSVGNHALITTCAHAIISAVDPGVPLSSSLVVVPLAMVSVYFPGTVGGLGVREMAFIALYDPLGVSATTATAGSLGLYACQALISLVGGALQILAPVEVEPPPEA